MTVPVVFACPRLPAHGMAINQQICQMERFMNGGIAL
jgi:hypothetical protein